MLFIQTLPQNSSMNCRAFCTNALKQAQRQAQCQALFLQ